MNNLNENFSVEIKEDTNSITKIIKRFLTNFVTVSTVYLFGYFNISIAWLIAPVLLNVFRAEWKKSSDRKRQSAKLATQNEKKVILSQIGDLPAWVYFPDIERAEWINKILVQLWPNINFYLQEMIKNVIEPKIQETLLMYKMNGFQFAKLRFGTIPPRIGGIKVYDKHIARTEIMMDIDLIYAGDCDISFYLKGFSAGIKDFQIHGMMRIVMKPLIPVIPFIGGVQLYFLNKPNIDFNLVGAADILDIPGISDVLRKVIVEQVSAMMVLPNKLPIVLSETIPAFSLKTPEPEGVLRVQIVQAIKLMKMDVGVFNKGKSDPYVIVTLGCQEFRSETINNTVNPKWDFWCETIVTIPNLEELKLDVWDWDPGLPGTENDDFLGRAVLKLNNALKTGELDTWLALEEVKHGMIHVRLFWYTLSSDVSDLKPSIEELENLRVPNISSAILILYLDSIQQLPDAKANKRPDPVVNITAGRETRSTGVQFRTNSPIYEQGFTFFIHNPETDSFLIKVTDQKSGLELGMLTYHLNNLLTRDEMTQEIEPFSLQKSGTNSKILFSAKLKILKKTFKNPAEPASDQSSVPDSVSTSNLDSTVDKLILENDVIVKSESTEETLKNVKSIPNEDATLDTDIKSLSSNSGNEDVNWESYKSEEVTNSCQWMANSFEQPSRQNSLIGNIKGSLRRRKTSNSELVKENSSIELTLNYVQSRQKLLITVHRIADLPAKDPSDLPDPYVKLYILPKCKENKRKTKVIKDSCNPVYEELFDYVISQEEIPYRQLQVIVISQKTSFVSRSAELGQVTLELKNLNLKNHKSWFPLELEAD